MFSNTKTHNKEEVSSINIQEYTFYSEVWLVFHEHSKFYLCKCMYSLRLESVVDPDRLAVYLKYNLSSYII